MTYQDPSSPTSTDDDAGDFAGDEPVFALGYHAVLVPDVGAAAALRFESIPDMAGHIAEHRREYSQVFCFGPEGRYPTTRSGHLVTPWGIYALFEPPALDEELDDVGMVGDGLPAAAPGPALQAPAPAGPAEDDDDFPSL